MRLVRHRQVLRRFNIPFTYLENCWLDSPEFRCGYEKFISVCAAVTAFRKTRVLQLGPRPGTGFWSVICNEGELIERFNIHTFPVSLIDLVDKTYEILKEKNSAFQNALKKITDSMRTQDCPREDVEKLAALKAAIQEMCEDHQCNCVAIQCWNALQSGLGIMPCLVNGLLIEEGIPVACETDIHGAVTSVLLQAAGLFEKPIFFADVTVPGIRRMITRSCFGIAAIFRHRWRRRKAPRNWVGILLFRNTNTAPASGE